MNVYRSITNPRQTSGMHAPAGLVCMVCTLLLMPAFGVPDAHGEETKPSAPTWQGVLTLQLKDEHRCDLDKVLFDRDVEAGGRVSKEGRVRCLDGREFDFSRPSTHETFDIRLCQPSVC